MDDRKTNRDRQIGRESGIRTGYLVLARLVAAFHGTFAAYAVLGGFLVRRYPALLWSHIAVVAWSLGTLALDWGCPVTPLEKSLRERGGTSSYEEGFVQHYLTRTALSPGDARRLHVVLAVALLLFNLFVYRSRLGLG